MKKLYIFGPPMSGKNILWKLLDGHPKLFVNQVHCSIGTHFLKENVINYYTNKKSNPIILDKKNLITINVKINTDVTINLSIGEMYESFYKFTSYKDLFTLSKNNLLITHNKELDCDYNKWNFKIDEFEKLIADEIFDCDKNVSIDDLISKLQELYCKASKVDHTQIEYFVDCLPNEISIIKKLKDRLKNVDIIFMKRNAIDHCYANMRRNLNSRNQNNFILKLILNKNNIDYFYMLNQYNFYKKHVSNYINELQILNSEKKYLIIKFEELILNTQDTMEKVIKYLGISKNQNLFNLTSEGQKINEKKNSLNKINDKADNIFSTKEIIQIENFYKKNTKYKYIFTFKVLLKVLMKKI